MRSNAQRRTWRAMFGGSRRFSIFLVFIMLMWTYTFINYSMYRNSEPDIPESERLRKDILDTSKKYVKALAKEQQVQGNLPEAYSTYGKFYILCINVLQYFSLNTAHCLVMM